jgi:putative tricarboxylic transport membrane protein
MKTDHLNGALFLIVSILICLGAARYPYGSLHNPGPGFLPLWLGVVLGGLSVVLLIGTALHPQKAKPLADVGAEKIRWGKVLIAIAALILYSVLMDLIGFLLVTFLFMAALIRFIDPQTWKKVIGWALVGSVGSYLIFEVWMKLRLPKGFLGV